MKSRSSLDPRPVSEAQVLKAVKQFLEAKGFRVFRRNTGAVVGSYTSKRTGKTNKRFVRFSEPGMADLYGWSTYGTLGKSNHNIKPGTHLEVEIKGPGKYLTDRQDAWMRLAAAGNCIAFWCDSVEMCDAKLKEWGI